jgi:uncharacterized membrane protein YvbJ
MRHCDVCGKPTSSPDYCSNCGVRFNELNEKEIKKLEEIEKKSENIRKLKHFARIGGVARIGIIIIVVGIITGVLAMIVFLVQNPNVWIPP